MSWDDGLDANGSRILTCGLSYADIVSVAGVNMREAARRLGVSEDHFGRTVKRLGVGHWYPDKRPRPRCVSKEDIVSVAGEGFTLLDSAHILGISYDYLKDLVKEWDLRSHFIPRSEAIWKGRRGYCD